MRCYAPRNITLTVIVIFLYLASKGTASHYLGMVRLAAEGAMLAGVAAGAAVAAVVGGRATRRRRAAAGACTTCRFKCQQAIMPVTPVTRPSLRSFLVMTNVAPVRSAPRSLILEEVPAMTRPRPVPARVGVMPG
jgi:hypothetical protein